jgi:glutathione S-transferase
MATESPTVRIYGFPVSTWTRTACMTCVEKGTDYELAPIEYGAAEHAALHPFMRIPILAVGDTTIFESLAINSYLDEAFPGPALQPTGDLPRVRMRIWMGLCGDYLFRDVVRAIPRDRTPTEEELGGARIALERAEELVGSDPFLVGSALTLADLYLAPQIANCREKAPALLEGLPALGVWAERISERESFRATVVSPPA